MEKEKRNLLVAELICITFIFVFIIWFLGWEAAILVIGVFGIMLLWEWKLEKLTQRVVVRYLERKARESRERGDIIFINPYDADEPEWEEGEQWERYYDNLNKLNKRR